MDISKYLNFNASQEDLEKVRNLGFMADVLSFISKQMGKPSKQVSIREIF